MSDIPRPSREPRPNHVLRNVLIVVGVVLVVFIAGAIVVTTRNAPTPETHPSPLGPGTVTTASREAIADQVDVMDNAKLDAEHLVEFRATTNRPGFVVFRVADGDGTRVDVTQSWSRQEQVKNLDGVFLKVKSLSEGDTAAQVNCEILVDGQLWSSDSGSGRGAFSKCMLRG